MKNTLRILSIFLGIGLLYACSEEKKAIKAVEYTGPIMTAEDLNVSYSDSGRVIVKMKTAKQMRMANGNEKYPKAVYVNFIDKNGVEYSSLRGDSGEFNQAEKLYILRGNVFFFNRVAQQSLSTPELFWTPRLKKIYSNKSVKINTPNRQIRGVGMEADQDFTKYTIRKVSGVFEVDSLMSQPTE
jgi:LPS export ABC transporter protein LptC